MKIFGLDTTRKNAKVVIYDNESGYKSCITVDENVKHSEGLFLYIEKILFESKLKITDFDAFASIVGPGSFTGIRVGMSTIKGFNKVAKKDVFAINMFEMIAPSCKNSVVLLNSTATSCYYATIKNKSIIDTGVVAKTDLINQFSGLEWVVLKEEQNMIDLEYNNIRTIDDIVEYFYAIIDSKIESGNKGEFVPYYIQLSQAERNLKNE